MGSTESSARLVLLAATVGASACASTAPRFAPIGPHGRVRDAPPAAYRELRVGNQRYGTVRVWSPGTYSDQDGRSRMLQVALRLQNDSDAPIRLLLDRTGVEVITAAQDFVPLGAAAAVNGALEVAPGAAQRIVLSYVLPTGLEHQDLRGFELDWAVHTAAGFYSTVTPFRQRREGPHVLRYVYWSPWYPPHDDPTWSALTRPL